MVKLTQEQQSMPVEAERNLPPVPGWASRPQLTLFAKADAIAEERSHGVEERRAE
jgi:hypothetical protein